jgi:hypothetical protein
LPLSHLERDRLVPSLVVNGHELLYEAAHSEEFDDHGGILIGGAGNSIQDQFGF